MLEVKGLNGESLVLDGPWLEKLRAGQSMGRVPVNTYRETQRSGRRGVSRSRARATSHFRGV